MPASLREVIIDLELLELDRQSKGLTIIEIARRGQINQSTVSNIFNGRRKTLHVLGAIAGVLGYDLKRYLPKVRARKGPRT